jgi:hypothetical protein
VIKIYSDATYQGILENIDDGDNVTLVDHIYGFDKSLNNEILLYLDQKGCSVTHHNYFNNSVKFKYKNINFSFDANLQDSLNLAHFTNYNMHPELNYKNFLCSFNGSNHVSRQLLSSILNNQGYFDPAYSSKNFAYNNNWITSHLDNLDLTDNELHLYSKFFVNSDKFNNSVYSFGHDRFKHDKNIYNLENKLTQSFIHIVSETMATSYYPFVTEKFLYSIITRGLFLAYAQPGWHRHIEKYYGFKLYDTIFDYSFDKIQNPVKRLIKLIETISKFSTLSADAWQDLYRIEQDNIEYNYEHYFSKNYLKQLAQYE